MSNNVSLGLAHEVEIALKKQGADQDFWKIILKDDRIAKKIVDIVQTKIIRVDPSFHFKVDYSQPIENILADVKTKIILNVDPCIIEENLKRGSAKNTGSIEATFFYVLHDMSFQEVINELRKTDWRPATAKELALLLQYYAKLIFKRSIYALGSVIQDKKLLEVKNTFLNFHCFKENGIGFATLTCCDKGFYIEDLDLNRRVCVAVVKRD